MIRATRFCSKEMFSLEGKLVYTLQAGRPINRAYKERFCDFKVISNQTDSTSEDSRSLRRLYHFVISNIYTETL